MTTSNEPAAGAPPRPPRRTSFLLRIVFVAALLFTLIGVSLVYFLLGAEFLGAAQLIIYVGGTLVLVVFGVMLTSQGPFAGPRTRPAEWIAGGVLAAALFALIVSISLDLGRPDPRPGEPLPGVGPLGLTFLGIPEQPGDSKGLAFLLPFEIVSVHLLVVLKSRGVTLAEVEAALAKRTGMSGLEEKASRKSE